MKRIYFDRYAEGPNSMQSRVWSPDADDLHIYALERRWLHNRSNISCIPAGVYALVPWESPNYGEVYAFVGGTVTPFQEDVPEQAGRWGNLLHPANYWNQLEGCVAPGLQDGNQGEERCVWDSRKALRKIRALLGYEPMVAYVRWKL